MTILDKIIAEKRLEIQRHKEAVPLRWLLKHPAIQRRCVSFKGALMRSDTGIIAEFKRKSPSKGWIHPEVSPRDIVPEYELGGAAACSILTDEPFFGGSLSDLNRTRPLVQLPLLRKDFMVDEYQLFQAKVMGADFILLIAAALSPEQVRVLAVQAHLLGMEVLLEVHTEEELDCVCPEIDVVGINNRNLKTFATDVEISYRLGEKIPSGYMKISESGISSPDTVKLLRKAGFKGFLMGENFMKEADPGAALSSFIKALAI